MNVLNVKKIKTKGYLQRLFVCLFIYSLLSGCTAFTTSKSIQLLPEFIRLTHRTHLKTKLLTTNNWQIKGRVGVSSPHYSGSASILWQQNVNNYIIKLTGPFGTTLTTLSKKGPDIIAHLQGYPYPINTKTPTELISQLTHYQLPNQALSYWIKGLEIPNIPTISKINNDGSVTSIRQQNWFIHYLSYQIKQGIPLPLKLRITHNALNITLLLNSWKITANLNNHSDTAHHNEQ